MNDEQRLPSNSSQGRMEATNETVQFSDSRILITSLSLCLALINAATARCFLFKAARPSRHCLAKPGHGARISRQKKRPLKRRPLAICLPRLLVFAPISLHYLVSSSRRPRNSLFTGERASLSRAALASRVEPRIPPLVSPRSLHMCA